MLEKKTPEYYKIVFEHTARILRVFHRELNFGFVTIVINRSWFDVRWTIRKKGHKKYVHSIPITFDSLVNLSPTEVFKYSEEIARNAKQQIPKELLNE